MSTLAELLVKVGVDLDDLEGGLDRASGFLDDNFAKITAAGVAAGAGLEAFARKNAPLNESLAKTAASLGINEGAMRDLALETSNVTFPLEEVLGLFEQGRRQGLETGEELQRFASFWDMVGDATGESGVALGEAGVALRAVGIAAGDEGKALDAFGFITENTTSEVGDFLKFLERTGPQLRDMGLDIDDAAAVLGVLENELGLSGRTARTEFRKAVKEADGDLNVMLETLGISAEQFGDYRGAVEGSGEAIERNAAIHEESYTTLQKVTHAAEELMFKYGGLADVAGMLAIPLLALGPALKTLTMLKGPLITLTKGLAAGFMALGKAVLVALAPFLLKIAIIALVVAAVVGLAILIVRNFDTIKKVIGGAIKFVVSVLQKGWSVIVSAVTGAVSAVVGLITGAWSAVTGATSAAWSAISGAVSSAVRAVLGAVTSGFRAVLSLIVSVLSSIGSAVSSGIARVVSFFAQLPGRVIGAIAALPSMFVGLVGRVISGGVSAFTSGIGRILGVVRTIPRRIIGAIPNPARILAGIGGKIIGGLIGGIKNALGGLGKVVGGVGGFIKKLKGPLPEDRRLLVPEGLAIMDGLIGGIEGQLPALRQLLGEVSQEVETGVDAVASAQVAVPPPAPEQVVQLDVTGADEDMKRMIRKWLRTAGLAVEVRGA